MLWKPFDLFKPLPKLLHFKPFHYSSGCMFRLVALLEDETSPQSQVFLQTLIGFLPRLSCIWLSPSSHQLRQASLSLLKKASPQYDAIPCFTVGMVCSGWRAGVLPHIAFCISKQWQFWSHLTREPSSTCLLYPPHGLWQTAWLCLNNGFLLATLP